MFEVDFYCMFLDYSFNSDIGQNDQVLLQIIKNYKSLTFDSITTLTLKSLCSI